MIRGRLTSVQSLRGVAALLVVIHHAISVGNDPALPPARAIFPLLPGFGGFGASGVDLFFVISGFVMAHGLDVARPGIASFLARRALRVLPMFWLLTVPMIGLGLWEGKLPAAASLLNTITVIPLADGGNFHFHPLYVGWSLGFEAVLYLLVAMATRSRRPGRVLLGLTMSCAAAGLVFRGGGGAVALGFVANPIFAEFSLGILAWMVWRRGLPKWACDLLVVGALLLFVASLVGLLSDGLTIDPLSLIQGQSGARRALIWGVPAAMLLLGLAAAERHGETAPRGAVALGDASYSLYLVHPIVIGLLLHAGIDGLASPYGAVSAKIGLSLLAGLAVHRWIEAPLLARLHRAGERTPERRTDAAVSMDYAYRR